MQQAETDLCRQLVLNKKNFFISPGFNVFRIKNLQEKDDAVAEPVLSGLVFAKILVERRFFTADIYEIKPTMDRKEAPCKRREINDSLIRKTNANAVEALDNGEALAFAYAWRQTRYQVEELQCEVIGIMPNEVLREYMDAFDSGFNAILKIPEKLGILPYITENETDYLKPKTHEPPMTEWPPALYGLTAVARKDKK